MPLVEELHIVRENPQAVPVVYFSGQCGVLTIQKYIIAQFLNRYANALDDIFN